MAQQFRALTALAEGQVLAPMLGMAHNQPLRTSPSSSSLSKYCTHVSKLKYKHIQIILLNSHKRTQIILLNSHYYN